MTPVDHIRNWQADYTSGPSRSALPPRARIRGAPDGARGLRPVEAPRHRAPRRHRQDWRGRSDSRARHRERPHDRSARRHGRAADAGRERLRAQVALRRPDARLRPRRPHDDAARGRALPARDAQFRRHRVPDLPAGRGGLRRRESDDRGRPVRALPRRAGVRPSQLAGAAGGQDRHHAGPGDGRGGPDRDHDRRPRRTRRASALGDRPGAGGRPHHHRGAVDRQPQREPDRYRGGQSVRDAGGQSGRDERHPGARETGRHRADVPAGDAGHDRTPAERADPGDRGGVRRQGDAQVRTHLSGDDQPRRRDGVRDARSRKGWSAATT